ncbi:hypothetical protein LCGC14_3002890 [marine sediment metagenome]|uniref:Uncharacterized protein n=1 Tax=marine sediment metagenome TaxID=412755 RepID=A0A0F8XN38_9ZZZZ
MKISSYQKLKAKNQQLTNDIKEIVRGNQAIQFKYQIGFDVEDAIWHGDACTNHPGLHRATFSPE